jgi:hypothetical protein
VIAATVAVAVSALLSGCGETSPVSIAPPAHSPAERQWIANAKSFIGTLNSDVIVSTVGGGNLATARRVLRNQSDIYSLLVAYDLFGACRPALANVGTPSQRANAVAETLISVCGRLQHASALFSRAMTRRDPASLLDATRTVLTVVPLLVQARTELASLR